MPGRKIADRYELLHRIGSGAMASVYLAEDHQRARKVAIKLLLTANDDDQEDLYYFQREARAAAALRHSGIVRVFEYSSPDEVPAYIVMEAIDGVTLKQVIEEHSPLPEDAILALLLQVSAALAYAHGEGVIHRDIKPANIMVTPNGRVCLSDFGLAKAYKDPELLGATVAGRVTGLAGTPAYMAPEQVLAQKTSPASDVFSTGCLAFALSTGHSPFSNTDLVEIYRAVSEANFVPLEQVRAGLSRELIDLIHGCLRKDPKRRPSTKELNAVLHRIHRAGEHPPSVTSIKRLLSGETGGHGSGESAQDPTVPARGQGPTSAANAKAAGSDTDRSPELDTNRTPVPSFDVEEEPRPLPADSGDDLDPADFEAAQTRPEGYDRLERANVIESADTDEGPVPDFAEEQADAHAPYSAAEEAGPHSEAQTVPLPPDRRSVNGPGEDPLAPTALMTRPDLVEGGSEILGIALWAAAALAIAGLLIALAWFA